MICKNCGVDIKPIGQKGLWYDETLGYTCSNHHYPELHIPEKFEEYVQQMRESNRTLGGLGIMGDTRVK